MDLGGECSTRIPADSGGAGGSGRMEWRFLLLLCGSFLLLGAVFLKRPRAPRSNSATARALLLVIVACLCLIPSFWSAGVLTGGDGAGLAPPADARPVEANW